MNKKNLTLVILSLVVIATLVLALADGRGNEPSAAPPTGADWHESAGVSNPNSISTGAKQSGMSLVDSRSEANTLQPVSGIIEDVIEPLARSVFDEEISRFMNGFTSDDPDVAGWTDYLSILSSNASVDPGSIFVDEDGAHGELTIPGRNLSISFLISDSAYKIRLSGDVDIDDVGSVKFHSVIAGAIDDGNIRGLGGVVQLYPKSDQEKFKQHPMGYIYEIKEGGTAYTPMLGSFDGGNFSVTMATRDKYHESEFGSLVQPYMMILRLQEIAR